MSIQIPLDQIEAAATDFGGTAFVLVSAAEGPPRITHSFVRFEGSELIVSIGGRAAAALAGNPSVAVLWPSTVEQSMSLIADGETVGSVEPDGGEVRIALTGAVLHRPATG